MLWSVRVGAGRASILGCVGLKVNVLKRTTDIRAAVARRIVKRIRFAINKLLLELD
jgi:hypothetical protein